MIRFIDKDCECMIEPTNLAYLQRTWDAAYMRGCTMLTLRP